MRTQQDLEKYLFDSPYASEEVADGTWLVRDPSQPEDTIVVRAEDDLIVYRLKVLSASQIKDAPGLHKRLLQLNGADIAHGAYALVNGDVVITAVARLDTLDAEELRSTIDDFVLAVQNHRATLKGYCA
ncbi:MAG: hypothetical protein OXU20_06530 [Myxococcales bacterium]|nr:hypothetical protein [Myxococcales bacterium]MDD9968641.1 hypothetical protein [Myxococcales bacterium]